MVRLVYFLLFFLWGKKKSPTLRTISTVPKTASDPVPGDNLLLYLVYVFLIYAQLSFSNDRGVWCQISYYVQTYQVQDKYFYVRKHFVIKVKK